MSHVSEALKHLIQTRPGYTQVALCELSGVSQPQMSRYFAGANLPSTASIAKICEKLPEEDRGLLAAAYLRDLLPTSAQDLVTIISETSTPVEPRDLRGQVPMSKELRAAFEYLERMAMRHTAVADSIVATARVLKGDGESYGSETRVYRESVTPAEAERREREDKSRGPS